MAKVNFTAARVEAHHCPRGQFTRTRKPIDQAFLWDAKTPDLGLRATVSGAKTYIFQAKLNGSTVRVTIGDPRSWTLDKAQKTCSNWSTTGRTLAKSGPSNAQPARRARPRRSGNRGDTVLQIAFAAHPARTMRTNVAPNDGLWHDGSLRPMKTCKGSGANG